MLSVYSYFHTILFLVKNKLVLFSKVLRLNTRVLKTPVVNLEKDK